MEKYKFTQYFIQEVIRKRPYINISWCIQVIESPLRIEIQGDGRIRFWGRVDALGSRILRVVTLEDKRTIHNAFPDRGFIE